MGETKIEWAEKVWNAVTGCTKVSEGCRNCYAERMSKRLAGRAGYPEDGFKVTLHPERLVEPLRWKKPSRIFVCSMGDLFHKDVPDEFIAKVLDVIAKCPQHTFLVLTKRPQRMYEFLHWLKVLWANSPIRPDIFLPSNLIFGTSVENQPTADERITWLIKVKGLCPTIRIFISFEPALGAADFSRWLTGKKHKTPEERNYTALKGDHDPYYNEGLDWVIMGGESGPGARPMHPDWARSVRDQCQAAGTPFFFKQWGEWAEFEGKLQHGDICISEDAEYEKVDKAIDPEHYLCLGQATFLTHLRRVGKKAAGCLLDGKEHKERP